jgi:putative membrane protein
MYRQSAAKIIGLVSLAGLAALATPAGAQSTTISAADRAFMMKAAAANIAEIAAGTLAEQRGSATVRLLGKGFVDTQRLNQQQLVLLAQQLNVTLPTRPSAGDQAILQHLRQLNGPAFDAAYLSTEQKAHMRNIGAFKTEIGSSASAPVVAYAKASLNGTDTTAATNGSSTAAAGTAVTSTAPADPGSQPVANPNGSSQAINTSPATGAGQTSGAGTPNSPNDGSNSTPGSPAGPGR